MSNSTQKREVLVALDAEFAEKIEQLTDNIVSGRLTAKKRFVVRTSVLLFED